MKSPTEPDGERILLLECRLEQARSALDEARADADRVRARLADAAAREADHARRYSLAHQELAEARAEVASLHERLGRSEALRAELEGHFFEGGPRDDAVELLRLRREVLAQRDRCLTSERAASRLRTRVDDLLQSREALLSRVATWQRLIRKDGPEAVDLAEFMAELRRDILDLEHQTVAGERREAELRKRLVRAGMDPGVSQGDEPTRPAAAGSYADFEDFEVTAPERTASAIAESSPGARHPGAAAAPAESSRVQHPCAASAAEPERIMPADEDVDLFGSVPPATVAPDAELVLSDDDLAEDDDAAVVAAVPDWEPVEAPAAAIADAATDEPAAVADAAIDEPGAAAAHAPIDESVAADAAIETPDAATDAGPSASTRPTADVVRPEASPAAGAEASELTTADPDARAAAYGRMVPLLAGEPARLADHLRAGLADPHPRVRRRTVLAAATARSVALHPLLDPLRGDPDPQVRRVVREVLRHALAAAARADDRQETEPRRARSSSAS